MSRKKSSTVANSQQWIWTPCASPWWRPSCWVMWWWSGRGWSTSTSTSSSAVLASSPGTCQGSSTGFRICHITMIMLVMMIMKEILLMMKMKSILYMMMMMMMKHHFLCLLDNIPSSFLAHLTLKKWCVSVVVMVMVMMVMNQTSPSHEIYPNISHSL